MRYERPGLSLRGSLNSTQLSKNVKKNVGSVAQVLVEYDYRPEECN